MVLVYHKSSFGVVPATRPRETERNVERDTYALCVIPIKALLTAAFCHSYFSVFYAFFLNRKLKIQETKWMKNPASISQANEIPMNFKQRKITDNINKQTLLRLCGKVYDLFAITFVRNECVRCGFSFIIILMVSIFFLVSVSSQYTRFRYTRSINDGNQKAIICIAQTRQYRNSQHGTREFFIPRWWSIAI